MTMHCTALIVDDEPLARRRLRSLLEERYSSEIEILEEAGSGKQAIDRINEFAPDVVFLDIQMPDMNAFDVLNALDKDAVPLVIFTTAFEHFALRAFEENTVDYILKPIEQERLDAAVEKLRKFFPENPLQSGDLLSWERLHSLVEDHSPYLHHFFAKIGDRTVVVKVSDIVRIHSEDRLTVVYTQKEHFLFNMSLVDMEKRLDPRYFVRIHRSHIVALNHVQEFHRSASGKLVAILDDFQRTELLVSREMFRKLQEF